MMRLKECNKQFLIGVKNLLLEYDNVKKYLGIQLCDAECSSGLLKDVVYTREGDFAAIYIMVFPKTQICKPEELADLPAEEAAKALAIRITSDLLELWGVTKSKLREDALLSERMRGIKFTEIDTFIATFTPWQIATSCGSNLLNKRQSGRKNTLYVLTNPAICNGAALILQPDIMAKIGEFMGGDYFVLPSSRHEVMVMACDSRFSVEELSEMVYTINRIALSPEDYLSDKVQHYCTKTGTLVSTRKHKHC